MFALSDPSTMERSAQVRLKWNNHPDVLSYSLQGYCNQTKYSDAMIACDGRIFMVHRIILSTCSDYFSNIFQLTPNDHNRPILILNETTAETVEWLLAYMYCGEVTVRKDSLPMLFKLAEYLKIKGLSQLQTASDCESNQTSFTGTNQPPDNTPPPIPSPIPPPQLPPPLPPPSQRKPNPSILKRKSSSRSSKSKKSKPVAVPENPLQYQPFASTLQVNDKEATTQFNSNVAATPVLPAGRIVLDSIPASSAPVVAIPISSLPAELQAPANAGNSAASMPLLATYLMGKARGNSNALPSVEGTRRLSSEGIHRNSMAEDSSSSSSSYRFTPDNSANGQPLMVDIKDEVKEEPLTLGPDDPISMDDDEDNSWDNEEQPNAQEEMRVGSTPVLSQTLPPPRTTTTTPTTLIAETAASTGMTLPVIRTSMRTSITFSDPTFKSAIGASLNPPVGASQMKSSKGASLNPPVGAAQIKSPVSVPTVPTEAIRSSHVLPQIITKPTFGKTTFAAIKESNLATYAAAKRSHAKSKLLNSVTAAESGTSVTAHDQNKSNSGEGIEVEEINSSNVSPPDMNHPESCTLTAFQEQPHHRFLEVRSLQSLQSAEEDKGLQEMMEFINEGDSEKILNFYSVDSDKKRKSTILGSGWFTQQVFDNKIKSTKIASKNDEPVKFCLTGASASQVVRICMRYTEEKFKNTPVNVCRLHAKYPEPANFRVSTAGETTGIVYSEVDLHPTVDIVLKEGDFTALGNFEFFVTFICLNSCHKENGKKMDLVFQLLDPLKVHVLKENRFEVRVCKNVKRDYKELAFPEGESCLKVLVRPDSFLYPEESENRSRKSSDLNVQIINIDATNESQGLEHSVMSPNTLSGIPGPLTDGPNNQGFYLVRLPNSKKGKMVLDLVREFEKTVMDLETTDVPEENCQDH